MKFIRFLNELDFDISQSVIQYGNHVHLVYVFNQSLIIRVQNNNTYCLFQKDEFDPELTEEFVLSFADNINRIIDLSIKQSQHSFVNYELDAILNRNKVEGVNYNPQYLVPQIEITFSLQYDYTNNKLCLFWGDILLFTLENEDDAKKIFNIIKKQIAKFLHIKFTI